jgi:predicted RecB family endonuclease
MAISTTSLDSIRQEARQSALSGNKPRQNPAAELAKELGSTVQQTKQQTVVSSLAALSDETKTDSIRVTSTIGKAASSGQLSREEAVAIYKEIANLL